MKRWIENKIAIFDSIRVEIGR